MPECQNPPSALTPPPSEEDAAPRFADGTTPEAPPRERGWLVLVCAAFVVVCVALLRALSHGTRFLLVGGIYFPPWFSAGVIGAALATVTIIALRSYSITRAAGTGLVFLNCSVIYAFLAWLLLFQ